MRRLRPADRRWATGLLLAAIVAAGCRERAASPAARAKAAPSQIDDRETIGWVVLDPGPRPAPSYAGVPRSALPALYRSRYRIKPDRRMLYAAAEIERLISGRNRPAVLGIAFEDGAWRISIDRRAVGALPEFPRFADYQRLLGDWTSSCLAAHGVHASPDAPARLQDLETRLFEGDSREVVAALTELNRRSAGHPFEPAAWRAAARGTAWLLLQTTDPLQLSDALAGHSAALLAIARGLTGEKLELETAWVAAALGYDTAAAGAVGGDVPIRLFALGDTHGLDLASRRPGSSRSTHYLHLLDRARRWAPETWFAALRASPWVTGVDAASLHLVLAVQEFQSEQPAAQALIAHAFTSAATRTDAPMPDAGLWGAEAWPREALHGYLAARAKEKPPESRSIEFEKAVAERAGEATGPFLDSESAASWHRALYYGGIHETARFLFDVYSSTDAAEAFARSLGDPAPGTATELKRWMLYRVRTRRGSVPTAERVAGLDDFRHIGVVPVVRVFYPFFMSDSSIGTDPQRRTATQGVFRVLDSRPTAIDADLTAVYRLADLRIIEALLRVGADECPIRNRDSALRLAFMNRDSGALRRMALDPRFDSGVRMAALTDLATLKAADPKFVQERCEQLMDEDPESTAPVMGGARLLAGAGDDAGAHRLIRRWLAHRPGRKEDLAWASVLDLQANLLGDRKKWSEAWSTIEPAIATWQGGVLETAAWIQEERGDLDEALSTARGAYDRYRDAISAVIVGRILWRKSDYAGAAHWLVGTDVLTEAVWNDNVAGSFARVFRTADPHETEKAYRALQETRVPASRLAALARAIGNAGDHRLAFSLLRQIRAGGADVPAIEIWSSDELKASDGAEAAAEWLRKNTQSAHHLAMIAYQFRRFDILWIPVEDPARASKDDSIQLMRAASLYQEADLGGRREGVTKYFEARPREQVVTALYLLGRVSRDELFAARGAQADLATQAWALAIRAAGEGRYEEASDWFQIAVEAGPVTSPPATWSVETLYRWIRKNASLEILARDKVL